MGQDADEDTTPTGRQADAELISAPWAAIRQPLSPDRHIETVMTDSCASTSPTLLRLYVDLGGLPDNQQGSPALARGAEEDSA